MTKEKLSAANEARLAKCLEQEYRFADGGVMTLRQRFEKDAAKGVFAVSVHDGMMEWSRGKFNRLDLKGQKKYEAKLKEKRLYFVNSIKVPKLVWDWALENGAKGGENVSAG